MKMKPIAFFAALILGLLPASFSPAAPRHDICADLGPSLPVGLSSFSAAGDWLVEAHDEHGVAWGLVYIYLVPPGEDIDGQRWFINHKAEVARSVGAIPVYTFYQILHIGRNAGLTGSEPEIVRAVMEDGSLMRAYFDNFVIVLQAAAGIDPPVIVHVEPDSWGFMMWAMGVEGNGDATSIFAQVDGSGHPGAAGLPDNAAGLGRALVHLRDTHAPHVRLGWHASNFRVGTRPEVVTSFFAGMGDWDVLFTENPHNEADESSWWEPWDEELTNTNLAWFDSVTAGAGVPILLWQLPIGTTDWHLLADPGDRSMLERFAAAGVAGLLFEHLGEGDPDQFRGEGALGTVPPAETGAGGTAADMRGRLAAYSADPLAWPEGSPCRVGGPADVPDIADIPDSPEISDPAEAPGEAGPSDADSELDTALDSAGDLADSIDD
ncbi:MAG: hypothetical protein ABIJ56_01815, partial [Pseudomonadota bacterium]